MKSKSSAFSLVTGLLFLSLLLGACGGSTGNTGTSGSTPQVTAAANKPKVIVGSKNFTEDILVAEMYAAALENAGIPVERKLNLGSTPIAQEAITKGDISLYPEYTGTALLNVLKEPLSTDPQVVYTRVLQDYKTKFNLAVLNPAPMNDTNAIVVTKAVADKYHLTSLSDLSKVADQLRFAAIADFVGPRSNTDGIGSLQKTYGGFHFKSTQIFDIKLKYSALRNGQADAAVAFSTDGEIAGYGFSLMQDDKHNFPPYQLTPIVRPDILTAYPNIKDILNGVSAKITDNNISTLNFKVDGPAKMDAADVAKTFLKAQGLIK